MSTCRNEGARRVVVLAGGVLAGRRVGVRLQLPIVACAAHSHPGAFWAVLLRTLPRAFAALLASSGVAVPRWRHARVRFVSIATTRMPLPAAGRDIAPQP